jgi:hypothetical protein
MAAKSADLARKVLLKNLKNQDYTVGALYLGVTIGGVEVSGNGYARVALTLANWTDPVDDGSGGQKSTYAADIFFPIATGNWGTIDGFVLKDAPTGGNTTYGPCPLSLPILINANDRLVFYANQLVVHES